MIEPTPSTGPSWMGCLIPLIGAVVVVGFPTCVAVTGLKMDRAIAEFAEQEPRYYGRGQTPLGTEESRPVQAKLENLRAAAHDRRRVESTFNVAELNHFIQTEPVLQSLRDTSHVVGIGPGGLEVECSLPSRKLFGGFRYLNGRFVFQPVPSETNAWQLELRSFHVAGKKVPEGFLRLVEGLHLFRFDLGAKDLQEVLRRVERMDLQEGKVVVATRGQ
jgi:hypothetical protein